MRSTVSYPGHRSSFVIRRSSFVIVARRSSFVERVATDAHIGYRLSRGSDAPTRPCGAAFSRLLNPFVVSPSTPFVLSLSKERTALRTGLSNHEHVRMFAGSYSSFDKLRTNGTLLRQPVMSALRSQAGAHGIMNRSKRQFISRCATIVGASALSRVAGHAQASAQSKGALANWAGNYRYSTDRLHRAQSVQQVQEFVKQHGQLKVLGTRHCFNGIADSTHNLLSLREMNQVVALDAKSRTVTVEAGMSYGQLCPYLHEKGFALHNLASLPHISIAGASATATHGSGIRNGNLATAVSALELVTADGEVLSLSREKGSTTFQGGVVNLGALGVVTKVTLDVQPAFEMRQDVYLSLPMAQVKEHFEDIMSAGYSVSLFTDWQEGRVNEVWLKRRIEKGTTLSADPEFYGATLATKNVHPIVELSPENCTEQMGVPGPWYERLPHFRMGFTPSSGKELQSEFFVPRPNAVEAILAVERLRDHVSPHLMISELRTIDADTLWMSTCYGRPSLAIHFTWKQDWESVRKVLPMIERELAPFNVRPHWGKLFTVAPAQLRARYEKWSEFKLLVARYDPKGKFRNEFLTTTLYS
jgi:xylitol oxidase